MLDEPFRHHWMSEPPAFPRGTIVRVVRVDDRGHIAYRVETRDGQSTDTGLWTNRDLAVTDAARRGWIVAEERHA